MKRKYIPKYTPTSDETFTQKELSHLINNIKRYEDNRFFRQAIPWLIMLASVFLYFFLK